MAANRSETDPTLENAYLSVEGLSESDASLLQDLARRDWAFADAKTQQHAHGIHPYPAKFIPQIPRRLIKELHPKDGTATFDPFCGSGTTLLESVMQGIPAIGVDINPLAVLLSKVKSRPLDEPLNDPAHSIAQRARAWIEEGDDYNIPEIPRLDHWFQDHVAKVVAFLVDEIRNVDVSERARDALKIALSSILVKVSNQESNTRYAAVEKDVSETDVVSYFETSAIKISNTLNQIIEKPLFPDVRSTEVTVIQADSRELRNDVPDWNVGLIVTSPPYPNAYEYWLYHKYRMYWLDMDPISAKENEIGARPFYSKENGLTADDFERHMHQCFLTFNDLLEKGRYVCILVGNSQIRGEAVDNGEIIKRVGKKSGFALRASIPREIPSTSSSFNPSNRSTRNERVMILESK